jgi:hypothetical protein
MYFIIKLKKIVGDDNDKIEAYKVYKEDFNQTKYFN